MHFWIDKRAQACSFGRPTRVSASLSNTGNYGLGYGHHPPRRIGKQSGPNIHRLNSQEFNRSVQLNRTNNTSHNNISNNNISNNNSYRQIHYHYNRNANRSNSNNTSNNQYHHVNTNHINHSNNSNNHNNNNINNNNSNSNNTNNNGNTNLRFYSQNYGIIQELPENQNISPHHQFYSSDNSSNARHNTDASNNLNQFQQLQNHRSNLNYNTNNHHHNDLSNLNNTIGMNTNLISNQGCSYNINNRENQMSSEQMPNNYGNGGAETVEVEENSFETYNTLPSNQFNSGNGNSSAQYTANTHMVDNSEFQLLPTHLKCGMWAALVLASVFVAGAKFYFDHNGNGLEVLIFCAFLATFFLAACTVSLCRLPKNRSSSVAIDRNSTDVENNFDDIEHNNLQTNQYQNIQDIQHENEQLPAALEPPPPYHIAILFPESNKMLIETDEAPPPSYDKIIV